jgi:hypothetical protein
MRKTKAFGVFHSLLLLQRTNSVRSMLEMELTTISTMATVPNYTNKTLLIIRIASTLCGSATTTPNLLIQPTTSCLLATMAHLKKLLLLLTTKVSVSPPTIGGNSRTCWAVFLTSYKMTCSSTTIPVSSTSMENARILTTMIYGTTLLVLKCSMRTVVALETRQSTFRFLLLLSLNTIAVSTLVCFTFNSLTLMRVSHKPIKLFWDLCSCRTSRCSMWLTTLPLLLLLVLLWMFLPLVKLC